MHNRKQERVEDSTLMKQFVEVEWEIVVFVVGREFNYCQQTVFLWLPFLSLFCCSFLLRSSTHSLSFFISFIFMLCVARVRLWMFITSNSRGGSSRSIRYKVSPWI
jgi:hypothetical protein